MSEPEWKREIPELEVRKKSYCISSPSPDLFSRLPGVSGKMLLSLYTQPPSPFWLLSQECKTTCRKPGVINGALNPAVLRSSGVGMQYMCMGWRQPSKRSCVFLAKDPSSCPADGVFVGRILGGSAWLEFGFQFASVAPSWKPVRSQKRWEIERLGWEWR